MRIGLRLAVAAAFSLGMEAEAGGDDRRDGLVRAMRVQPDVAIHLVEPAVDAALAAESSSPDVDAAMLLRMAWFETRLDPRVRTGVVCGIVHVNPTDIGRPRSDCDVWSRDVAAGFRAGVEELRIMLADRRVGGRMTTALLYRACGDRLFNGTCRKGAYAGWVLRGAQEIRALSMAVGWVP